MKHNNKPGFFVVIEGPDGVGKSTVTRLLADKMGEEHLVHSVREPGSTRVAEDIREFMASHNGLGVLEKVALFFAARYNLAAHIRRCLDDGYVVISDRYYMSTLVYQKLFGNASSAVLALRMLEHLEAVPDLTIVLLPEKPEMLVNRTRARDGKPEFSIDTAEQLCIMYGKEITREKYTVFTGPCHVVSVTENDSPEQVAKTVFDIVRNAMVATGATHTSKKYR